MDTNCIIDLEEERESACYIRELVLMHKRGRIELSVSAISASERKTNGKYASNFTEFQQMIRDVGLEDVKILKPPGIWDVTYWDWCTWGDEETEKLQRDIHQIMFPKIKFSYSEERNTKRWRNAKCDVLALCCHIRNEGDIFVTSNTKGFHQITKKPKLIALGAGQILYPKETISILTE